MHKKTLVLILVGVFLVACNVPGQAPSSPATPNVDALVTQALATLAVTQMASSTPTLSTSTPTIPATEAPKIYFAGDTNCRTGPGVKFTLVTIIKEGQTAQLVGQSGQVASSANNLYWVVTNPNGSGPCWVVRDFATPQGNIDKLVMATPPPTYTPMPRPEAPLLADWQFSCEYASPNDQTTSTITVELKWRDMSDYELGYDIYRNDELLASLPANTTAYTDVTYLVYGQGITYSIEAWNNDGVVRSKDAKAQCQ
jgi:hypothetical protein